MKAITFLLLLGSIVYTTSFAAPKIILKLDDFEAKNNSCLSIPTMDYLISMQIKASFGAIAGRFDATSTNLLSPYLSATNSNGEKLFDIWNHGLYHTTTEFTSSYADQKNHFDSATMLIKRYLGVQMRSFGSPYNASDATTVQVISEDTNYKVIMFGDVTPDASTGIINLTHRVNMENGTGNPQYDYFVTNYNNSTYTDYMVLQGHPKYWGTAELDQFKQIVQFLISKGCQFVQPYEYYLSVKGLSGTNIALNKTATASNVYNDNASYNATKAVDGSTTTRWATNDGIASAWLEIDLGATYTFAKAVTKEYSNRVASYKIQYWSGSAWKNAFTGTTIGSVKTDLFTTISATKVRLNIVSVTGTKGPSIYEFSVFGALKSASIAPQPEISEMLEINISPNPIKQNAVINYSVPIAAAVKIDILGVTGQLSRTFISEYKEAGNYRLTANVTDLPEGVYIIRLTSGGNTKTVKTLIVK